MVVLPYRLHGDTIIDDPRHAAGQATPQVHICPYCKEHETSRFWSEVPQRYVSL